MRYAVPIGELRSIYPSYLFVDGFGARSWQTWSSHSSERENADDGRHDHDELDRFRYYSTGTGDEVADALAKADQHCSENWIQQLFVLLRT